ncbi:MAG: MmgE/PrpD family protein, partial [Acetobacteraceae bacterium]
MTTQALAEFTAGLRAEDLPPAVIHQACRVVLDAIGCAIAAWVEDPAKARVAREIAARYHARPGAGVIGVRGSSSHPAFAALANGMLVNAADNDDTHKRALLHVGSVVVPTSLALAETNGLSGRELLVALV